MRLGPIATTLLATLLVPLALAAPAAAQDKLRGDNRDDATPAFNITSVRVQNHAENFAFTVKVQDLRRGTGQLDVRLTRPRGTAEYGIEDLPVSRGRTVTRLTYAASADSRAVRVDCDGLTAARGLRVDKIRVVVPRRCLPALPATIAVSDLALYPKHGDRADGDDLRTVITTRRG